MYVCIGIYLKEITIPYLFFFSVDCLGSFVQLLHLISQDVGVKEFLSKTVKSNTLTSESCSKVSFTKDELPQVWILIVINMLCDAVILLGKKPVEESCYKEKLKYW